MLNCRVADRDGAGAGAGAAAEVDAKVLIVESWLEEALLALTFGLSFVFEAGCKFVTEA